MKRMGEKSKSQQGGFSLIEILIVVAIVVVIAAIAVPNLLRSKVAGNEASAIGSLRNIMSAEAAYKAMYGAGYSNDLRSLGGQAENAQASCTTALLLDAGLAKGIAANQTEKSGYRFTFTPGTQEFKPDSAVTTGCAMGKEDGYAIQADPVDPGMSGKRHFCADASGVIRVDLAKQIPVTAPTCSSEAPALQ
ncbi:MAG TPA: prepilin-type N-terminal cleavage/methylation domain-containing protein [Candidatus Acidoferrales bacterium]|nr:prepilin-type N-terminal cleavage/methylation domain-containing protein [Candidatus Acidoferrales bacterium]